MVGASLSSKSAQSWSVKRESYADHEHITDKYLGDGFLE